MFTFSLPHKLVRCKFFMLGAASKAPPLAAHQLVALGASQLRFRV